MNLDISQIKDIKNEADLPIGVKRLRFCAVFWN